MARANSTSEVVHDLRSVGSYTDSGTATTLTATEPVGETSLAVASETGFVANDVLRVGLNGSTSDVGVVASTGVGSIVIDHGLIYSQASGNTVTKLTFNSFGHTTDAGATIEWSGDENALAVGTQVGTYLYMGGAVDVAVNFSLVNVSMENLLAALGIPESGVLASPAGANLDPALLATDTFKPWRLQGLDDGGNTVTFYIFAAKVAVPNLSLQYTTGSAMEVALAMRSVNVIRVTRE